MKAFILPILLLLSFNLVAQWTPNTDENTSAASDVLNIINALSTSQGETVIVYWKTVPAPTNIELRMQKLDIDGNKQLGEEGILVSENINMDTYTVVGSATIDAEDNIYIGVQATGDMIGHVFKLDSAGNHLWEIPDLTFPEGAFIKVLPLTNGEIVVSWFPSGFAKMQKYDAEGNALWDTPQEVVGSTNNSIVTNMFELSDGGYTAIFHANNFGVGSNLFAQRFDSEGVAQWGVPTQLSNKGTLIFLSYSTVQIGDVVYIGYSGQTNLRFDSFLQKIMPDGSIPWGINGADFDVNETNYETDTAIALLEDEESIMAVCTYENFNNRGIFAQKFAVETGERQLTDNAKEVFPVNADFNVLQGEAHAVDNQLLFLRKSGFDNGATPTNLSLVLLDENGDFVWEDTSKPVATFSSSKSNIELTKPFDGQAVTVWMADKGNGREIFAQSNQEDELTAWEVVEEEELLMIYPNPAEAFLYLKWNELAQENTQIQIYSTAGQLVFVSTTQDLLDIQNKQISIAGLPSGFYFLQLINQDGERIGKGKFMVK